MLINLLCHYHERKGAKIMSKATGFLLPGWNTPVLHNHFDLAYVHLFWTFALCARWNIGTNLYCSNQTNQNTQTDGPWLHEWLLFTLCQSHWRTGASRGRHWSDGVTGMSTVRLTIHLAWHRSPGPVTRWCRVSDHPQLGDTRCSLIRSARNLQSCPWQIYSAQVLQIKGSVTGVSMHKINGSTKSQRLVTLCCFTPSQPRRASIRAKLSIFLPQVKHMIRYLIHMRMPPLKNTEW